MEFIQLAFLLTAVQLILFSRADMKLVVMQKVFRCHCCLNKNFLLSLFYFFFESSSLSSASIYPNLSILFRPQESFECVCVHVLNKKVYPLPPSTWCMPIFTSCFYPPLHCHLTVFENALKNVYKKLVSKARTPFNLTNFSLRFFYFNFVKRKFGESIFLDETFLKDF